MDNPELLITLDTGRRQTKHKNTTHHITENKKDEQYGPRQMSSFSKKNMFILPTSIM